MTTKAEFMTPEQTAAYLNVPIRTLEKWRYLRRGPAYHRLSYREVRYKPADIDRWLKQQRRSA